MKHDSAHRFHELPSLLLQPARARSSVLPAALSLRRPGTDTGYSFAEMTNRTHSRFILGRVTQNL